MIICKKATMDKLEALTSAIIKMNTKIDTVTGGLVSNDNRNITKSEIAEYIAHMYYLYDTEIDDIVAIICGCRCDRTENIDNPMNSVMISMKRYEIKYFLHYDSCDQDSLINLVREFLADMNDYPTIYRSKNVSDNIKKAFRSNNFIYNEYLKIYIRLPSANTTVVW